MSETTLLTSRDPLIDDVELARMIGWSPQTPSRMRGRGTLPFPYVKIGRSVRYRLSVVNEYIAAHTVQPKAGVE